MCPSPPWWRWPSHAATSREPDVLAEAAAAMGGRARIDGVRTLALEGEGTVYALGQNRTLDSELLSWRVSGYRREVAFDDRRWREESARTPTFVTGWPGPAPLVEGYDDGVAYDVEVGAASRRAGQPGDGVPSCRAVPRPGRPASSDRRGRAPSGGDPLRHRGPGHRHGRSPDSGGRSDHQAARRIVSKGHEPALGDVNLVTELDDFVTVDGLHLPRHPDPEAGGHTGGGGSPGRPGRW